ncbi:MAG: TonB-dependent receptor domain-containing protein [Thermonemataceae bacterium]
MKFLVTLLLFQCYILNGYAQEASLRGQITDIHNIPLQGVLVNVGGQYSAISDAQGKYTVNDITLGKYEVRFSMMGFLAQVTTLACNAEQPYTLNMQMEEDVALLEAITIEEASEAEEKRASGYNVTVLETSAQKSLPLDLNQVIQNTPGVNIREAGGLGSGFSLSLNGLAGNQIRYFIDGVPMENFGSALTLNNFPINLVDGIEIYKGVVPVWLGADALGGAVNILTGYRQQTFLDASYTFGSFNTHRASINGQYANTEKGYFFKISSFFNHSDNNYLMRGVPLFDLELGNSLGNIDIRRFNDQYTSGLVAVEGGVFDKKYADEWTVKLTWAGNRNNYQHPDNNILRPFGAFHTRNTSLLASTAYKKSFKKLTLNAYLLGGSVRESVVDTSTRKYNCSGAFIVRREDDPKGELAERRSLLKLDDMLLRGQLYTGYKIDSTQSVDVSFTQNYLERTGNDEVDEFNRSFQSPNYIQKRIASLAYNLADKRDRFGITGFLKQYWYTGRIVTQDFENNDVVTEPSLTNTGFGGVFSYHPIRFITLKASYEKAYRIPEPHEILGDGIYINPNPALTPETSDNLNLGFRLNKSLSQQWLLKVDNNLFYRFSRDFIRFNPLGPFGEFENLSDVTTRGIEMGIHLNYNEWVDLQLNGTYQDLTDQNEFDEGLPNDNYQSRIPNIPYFFCNGRIGVIPFRQLLQARIGFYWHTRYVHEFFLTWENAGNPEDKNIIPSQLIHNFDVEYTSANGHYNITASITNLADALVYDNFNIQKPGRAMYLKFRYFFNKPS